MDTRCIGIRHEDKSPWERRVPASPELVRALCEEPDLRLRLERSPTRTWPDEAWRAVGADLVDDLEGCGLVLGVKEIPPHKLRPQTVYVFFSHTIKGQPCNMPLLRRILELECTLVDYECVADEDGRRLIFFGQHAGFAGMIDGLAALGGRLVYEGRISPLAQVRDAWRYADLADARRDLTRIAGLVGEEGFSGDGRPLIIGLTGYGNVSQGAQQILELFPHQRLDPEALLETGLRAGLDPGRLHLVVFREEHMYRRRDGGPFDLPAYFADPAAHEAQFERFLPQLDLLVNGVYWDARCPRLVTRDWVRRAWADGSRGRLKVIADISIDIEGSIECSLQSTESDLPCYVYEAASGRLRPGLAGEGPVILAVDNLPCEIPRDSSRAFSRALAPFLPAMARADWTRPLEALDLPAPIRRAIIAHRGALSPEFAYLRDHLADGA
jgi:alanine dehydrogenase